MSEPLPAAVALGDQIHAEMIDAAKRTLATVLDKEGLAPTEDQQLYLEMGIGAGVTSAMTTLVAMRLLKSAS